MPYIYLIHTRASLNIKEPVYKIGKTNDFSKRISGYDKGSIPILIIYVNNSDIFEKLIIETFKIYFIKRTDYGNEYFEGNVSDMIGIIMDKFKELNMCYNIEQEEQKQVETNVTNNVLEEEDKYIVCNYSTNNFKCNVCRNKYFTCNKKDFNKHLLSITHQESINYRIKIEFDVIAKLFYQLSESNNLHDEIIISLKQENLKLKKIIDKLCQENSEKVETLLITK
jgi:hypothetical protein